MGDDTQLDDAQLGHAQPSAAPRSWERWWLAVLLLSAFGLRALCVVQYEASHPSAAYPSIDEASYDAWGARIAQGEWLGHEVFFQEPLYPYFLGCVYSVFGHELGALRLVQCLLGALSVGLLFGLTRRLFGRGAGWIAGVALACYGPAILLPCLLIKPNLFLPLLAGFAWLWVLPAGRARRWLGLGVLGGLGALLRGNMLLLLPVFGAWAALWTWHEQRSKRLAVQHAASFLVGAALVLLPVLVRNQAVGGVFALTTSGAGTNVYGGNNADNPYGVATEFDWVRGIPAYEAEDWKQEAQRRSGRELSPTQVSDYWLNEALASMRRDPALHVGIFWNKLRLALGRYEVPDNHLYAWDRRFLALLRLPWPGFGVWGSLGLAGVLSWLFTRAAGRRGALPGSLALLLLAYLGTIVLTVMSSRARLPLVVLLLPFAGSWGTELYALARRRAASAPALAASLIVAVSIVNWPVFDARALAQDLDERDYNLAVQRVEQARLSEARTLGVGLLEQYPASARLRILLADVDWREGSALREAGKEAAGREAIRRALASLQALATDESLIARERSRAYRLAGFIQADLGAPEAAARFLGLAREFAPRDPELWLAHTKARLALCSSGAPEQRPQCRQELRAELRALIAEFEGRAGASVAEARALLQALEFGG